jgi:ActR/RegA family two-component response regulator
MTPHSDAPGSEHRHLLLVDDDPNILTALATLFERRGYSVAQAATGGAGIQAYRARVPDLVILDLVLPDMTGIAVLGELRKYDATVVMLTGAGDIPTAVKAMQLGAENFLAKPPDPEHLTAIVERAIEKSDLRRENKQLRRFVPTTRKRVIRIVVTALLLLAAAAVGLALGNLGPKPGTAPSIAPTKLPVNGPLPARGDTFPLAPGSPPPSAAPAPAPTRR